MTRADAVDIGFNFHPDGGELSLFPPGGVLPTASSFFTNVLEPANRFTSTLVAGGGVLPVSMTGRAVDVDADQVSDRMDVTLTYDDGTTSSASVPRTNLYDDYRCWHGGGGESGGCIPATTVPVCVHSGGPGWARVDATFDFKDADGDLNPGGGLGFSDSQSLSDGTGIGHLVFASIPDPGPGLTVTATGTTEGHIVATDATFSFEPGMVSATVGFEVHDVGGQSSWDLGRIECPEPILP